MELKSWEIREVDSFCFEFVKRKIERLDWKLISLEAFLRKLLSQVLYTYVHYSYRVSKAKLTHLSVYNVTL